MTVRFKSEYQKSFGAPRSRTTSAQCCPQLAGLRSDQMGVYREPRLQRRRRLGPVGPAHFCSPLFWSPLAPRRSPSPVDRKQPDPDPPASTGSPAEPEPPAESRASADSKPAQRPEDGPKDPESTYGRKTTAAKQHPSPPHSQSKSGRVVTSALGDQEAPNEVDLEPKARGQRSGGHKSEYHQQFSWKTPVAVDSPILVAEQALHSSSRFVPPFKKHPLPQETEYQRSFQGLTPRTGTQLRKHLEHGRTPLFQLQVQNNSKKRAESHKKSHPISSAHQTEDTRLPPHSPPSPPPQVHRRHRMSTEYRSSFRSPLCMNPLGGGATDGDVHQIKELKQQAQSYRHRAWGTHFSREHLSQLLSEHNGLWEPRDSPTDPPTSSFHPSPRPSPSPSGVEALDVASNSSRKSPAGSGGEKKTTQDHLGGRRTAWGERGDGENSEEEDGRLPTPQLKMKLVQRTHHDLTTPSKGGAMLVGKLKSADDLSPCRQRCESTVSAAAVGTQPVLQSPVKQKAAWSEKVSTPPFISSLENKSQAKTIRAKSPPPAVEVPSPRHGLHGTLQHANVQNSGLRSREAPCSGGCCSDEEDRLSVMSWRSAASCSAASVVLDRALKRREDFWGKT